MEIVEVSGKTGGSMADHEKAILIAHSRRLW
jgi:hypothetical protein